MTDDADPKTFYESSEDDAGEFGSKKPQLNAKKPAIMDSDHRLLLRNARPLLNSRNAAVRVIAYLSSFDMQVSHFRNENLCVYM